MMRLFDPARFPILKQLRQLRIDLDILVRNSEAAHARETEEFTRRLLTNERYADPTNLNHFRTKIFSQFGEDGIIQEIFRRIGTGSQCFLEIGVEDGLQTNTTYLLQKGWSGFWIEMNRALVKAARRHFRNEVDTGQLRIECAFVTAEEIAATLRELGVPTEFDLLSLDVDRNTYFLWEAMEEFRPRAVVVEYQGTIPPDHAWKVDYSPVKQWNGTNHFGASLAAFVSLGERLGYRLVGCDISGVNAFFVRQDLVNEAFAGPFHAETHYEPPRYWLEDRVGHGPAVPD